MCLISFNIIQTKFKQKININPIEYTHSKRKEGISSAKNGTRDRCSGGDCWNYNYSSQPAAG